MAATIGELYRETVSNDALIKSDQDQLAVDMAEAASDNRALLAALQARGKPGFVAYPQGMISVLSLSADGSQIVVQVFESVEDVPLPPPTP